MRLNFPNQAKLEKFDIFVARCIIHCHFYDNLASNFEMIVVKSNGCSAFGRSVPKNAANSIDEVDCWVIDGRFILWPKKKKTRARSAAHPRWPVDDRDRKLCVDFVIYRKNGIRYGTHPHAERKPIA